MKTLLGIFPEGEGWFVEGPLGSAPEVPKDILPFYERPRVIVPTVDDIPLATGRLFAAGSLLPVRRITRFDEKPGAKGLPGFRGIWCETESKDDIGFLILTPNQNRFLIWARAGYFPALAVDAIEPKIRDWYARSVADHLVSLDFRVPDNLAPHAGERSLPDWMDLYPPLPTAAVTSEEKLLEFLMLHRELRLGQCEGVIGLIPAEGMVERLIGDAKDTLYPNVAHWELQSTFRALYDSGQNRASIVPLTRVRFDSLDPGPYLFAVDRYGRVRLAPGRPLSTADKPVLPHSMLFPGESLLSAGWLEVGAGDTPRPVLTVSPYAEEFACSRYSPTFRDDIGLGLDRFADSIGHLLRSLRGMGISFEDVLIRKF
jgi:hypothetical protein